MAPLEDFLSYDELHAFLNKKDSDRAKAIVLAAMIENHLTASLKYAFREDAKIWNELFQPSGPLGDFGTKVRLAYMAKYIDSNLKNDLLIIARIRNEFAHKISVKSFEDQPVRDLIKNMYSYKVVVRIAEKKPDAKNKYGRTWQREMGKLKKKALKTMASTYRECLGHVVHELATNVEQKLRAANPKAPSEASP